MTPKTLLAVLLVSFVTGITIAQTTQPKLRLNTEMHISNINRISADAQGKYILTCFHDKTANHWDGITGSRRRIIGLSQEQAARIFGKVQGRTAVSQQFWLRHGFPDIYGEIEISNAVCGF